MVGGSGEALSQTFSVTVGDDPRDGPNGSLTATLSLPTPSTELVISTRTATVTINDNDDPPVFTVANEQASETADNIVFTARLSEASDFTVTVAYATGIPGSGSNPAEAEDFTETTGTLTFAPGDTAQQLTVPISADPDDDVDEFTLTFSTVMNASFPSSASGGSYAVTGTITELPTLALSADSASVDEGGEVVFTVTLSEQVPTAHQATLAVVAETGTIDGTSDFTLMVGGSGEPLSQTFTVTVGDNMRDGPNGRLTATLTLSGTSTELVISTGTVMVTINDDDAPPVFMAENAQANETADNIVFTARLSEASDFTVTVAYSTGTVGTGSDPAEAEDFTETTGTLTFAPGDTAQQLTVPISADPDDDVDEFTLTFSAINNASFPSSASGGSYGVTGTITELPTLALSADQPWVHEGGEVVFTVTLSEQVTTAHQAMLAVVAENGSIDGTAEFDLTVGGSESLSQTFTVTAGDNQRDGPDGDIIATLTLSGASTELVISTGTVMVALIDNDTPPFFMAEAARASETAGNIVFTARLSEASDFIVIADYATGTTGTGSTPAEAGDFTPVSGTLSFAPGEQLQQITVAVTRDDDDEVDEFTLTFSSLQNAFFPREVTGDSYGVTGTITELPVLELSASPSPWPRAGSWSSLWP